MVSSMICTASVRNILDTPSYVGIITELDGGVDANELRH
jgi:hypothetical protein